MVCSNECSQGMRDKASSLVINEVVTVIGSCEETGHQCSFMIVTRDTNAVSGETQPEALQAMYT